VKRWSTWAIALCITLVVLAGIGAQAATSSTLGAGRYKLGEAIVFEVRTSSTSWWSCSSCCQPACTDPQVLGWRVENASGGTVYAVIHDGPVAASTWEGTWDQKDSAGAAVAAGTYTLYVDTSVGTLSYCLRIYDPCGCCSWSWTSCPCQARSTITNCSCKTSLVLSAGSGGCSSLFSWWPWGGCGCSSCSGCSGCGCSTGCGSTPAPVPSPCPHCP